MSANSSEVTGLQALLSAYPQKRYRQGVGAIPIQAIRASTRPTRAEPQSELLEELVASIRITGVIQPLIVRPVEGLPHQFEVVAGERRFRAAQMAGLTAVPAVVRHFSDQESIAISLIENIQREELTPADEARALRRLTDEFALTHEQIARAIGRSRVAVTNLLRLLELPAEVMAMMDARTLSMGHARALLGIDDEAGRVRIAQLVATRRWSVRDTETQVRKMLGEKGASGTREPSASAFISDLAGADGLQIQLHQRADGRGKLVIEFADALARDAILQRLGVGRHSGAAFADTETLPSHARVSPGEILMPTENSVDLDSLLETAEDGLLKGRDIRSVGPSDSSDTGADMMGLSGLDSTGDRNGTGERAGVDMGADVEFESDIGADRIVDAADAGLGGGLDQAEEAQLGITDEEIDAAVRHRLGLERE
jgi:ParB family chromosome partitioning protein